MVPVNSLTPMFHCHACGALEPKYVAIGARINLDVDQLHGVVDSDIDVVIDVELYDDGVHSMPLRAPVYENDTAREPIDYKTDEDLGPFLRACVKCGTVRMAVVL